MEEEVEEEADANEEAEATTETEAEGNDTDAEPDGPLFDPDCENARRIEAAVSAKLKMPEGELDADSLRSIKKLKSSPVTLILVAPGSLEGSDWIFVITPSKITVGIARNVTSISTRENGRNVVRVKCGKSSAPASPPLRPASKFNSNPDAPSSVTVTVAFSNVSISQIGAGNGTVRPIQSVKFVPNNMSVLLNSI